MYFLPKPLLLLMKFKFPKEFKAKVDAKYAQIISYVPRGWDFSEYISYIILK